MIDRQNEQEFAMRAMQDGYKNFRVTKVNTKQEVKHKTRRQLLEIAGDKLAKTMTKKLDRREVLRREQLQQSIDDTVKQAEEAKKEQERQEMDRLVEAGLLRAEDDVVDKASNDAVDDGEDSDY
ncbi:MAG: hypothetical protein MHM6MM_007640 [Cercozoa sp. M6MM]